MSSTQTSQETAEVQGELNEKVDRLKAELVVYKSLMSDVSVLLSTGVMSPSVPQV